MKDNSETRHFIGYLHKHNITGVIIGVDSVSYTHLTLPTILLVVRALVTNRRIRAKAGRIEIFDIKKGEFEPAVLLEEKVKFSYNFENMKKYWTNGGRDVFIYRYQMPYRRNQYFVKEAGALSEDQMQIHIRDYRKAYDPEKAKTWIVPPGILGGKIWKDEREKWRLA